MSQGVVDDTTVYSSFASALVDEESEDQSALAVESPHSHATTIEATNADPNATAPTALTTEDDGERSPGPRLEEMANGDTVEGGDSSQTSCSSQDADSSLEGGTNPGINNSFESASSSQQTEHEEFNPDLRRVKVYELVGSRWTDRGTAFCQGDFDSDGEEARLIAKSEESNEVLLNCVIRPLDVYQRQHDTLIVWTEPDGTDFALSFQDVEGCSEVWDFIMEVQRHLKLRAISTATQIIQAGYLPAPTTDATLISEIEKAMRTLARSPKARESICNHMQEIKYIHQMVDTFEVAEREENLEVLHALCSCMQTILLFNEHQMYEHILTDELWMGVVGILEYDPEFPKHKANYREFLIERSKFLQPIAIDDQGIQRKIIQTYRLQYLKDVILGRALDDSTFNVLNSFIIFNQIDIITHIQQDEHFLSELVLLFIKPVDAKPKRSDSTPSMDVDGGSSHPLANGSSSQVRAEDDVERKKEVIALLQQMCIMGKNVQLPARVVLFRTLVERGVLYAIQWALCRPERPVVNMAGEILAVFLDHHTLSVRNHVLSQAVTLGQQIGPFDTASMPDPAKSLSEILLGNPPPFKETLSQVLCRMLANSHDFALQNQLADAIKMLTDLPPIDAMNEMQPSIGPKIMNRPIRDDYGTERFLENFYKVCVDSLFRPLTFDIPDHRELKSPLTTSRERGNLYLYLCDLLCSFAVQHSHRSLFFILSSNVVSHVVSLLSVRDKHLCLAALRFFRICLKLNNRNLFAYMNKHDCFSPIVKLTVREARRENLLSSTCQEFFEHMRKENLKDPIAYIMDKHENEMRDLAKTALGSATFHGFVTRWEINKEPPPELKGKPTTPAAHTRAMEFEDDDSYFHGDDDDDDQSVATNRADFFLDMFRRKRPRLSGRGSPTYKNIRMPNLQQRPVSPLSSLLDYDEDDDSTPPNQGSKGQEVSSPESPVTPHRQIQIPLHETQEPSSDPEDDLLEAIVSKKTVTQQKRAGPTVEKQALSTGMEPVFSREKRRRSEEVDDDDMLLRLTPKNRRLVASDDESMAKARPGATKTGEEGTVKRLKLKINASKSFGDLKSQSLSDANRKDGGNG